MMTSCCDFDFLVAIVLVVFLPSYVSILCRDLMVMSRPLLLPISFLLVATSILRCNRFPPSYLFSRSRPQGDVATSFAVYVALLHVATSVSSHDIVCGLFIKWSQLQFSCQENYIYSILSKYNIQHSKKGFTPFRYGINLSQDQCPMTAKKKEYMETIPYASVVGSVMYVMLCTRPNICCSVGIVSRYQSNPGREHWTAVKHILKYLRRMRDYMLVYHGDELAPIGYTDSDFQSNADLRKSNSGYVFTLGGAAVSWRSIKQSCIVDSSMEAEYVAASEAAKEAVWLRKFLMELGVIAKVVDPMILYCDNSGVVVQAKEPRNHRKGKHIERKYQQVREIVQRGDIIVEKIASEDNLADPFTKALKTKVFDSHVYNIGLRCTL